VPIVAGVCGVDLTPGVLRLLRAVEGAVLEHTAKAREPKEGDAESRARRAAADEAREKKRGGCEIRLPRKARR